MSIFGFNTSSTGNTSGSSPISMPQSIASQLSPMLESRFADHETRIQNFHRAHNETLKSMTETMNAQNEQIRKLQIAMIKWEAFYNELNKKTLSFEIESQRNYAMLEKRVEKIELTIKILREHLQKMGSMYK
jgi:hypothetical protein